MFEIFRRNQKLMMAFLVIFSMFMFSFGDFFRGCAGPTRQDLDKVVAQLGKEEITKQDLEQAGYNRMVSNNFVSLACYKVLNQSFPGLYFGDMDEQSLLDFIVQQRAADQAGITVSDQAVENWILGLFENLGIPTPPNRPRSLTPEQFRSILQSFSSGRAGSHMDERTLFDILRQELRVQKLQTLATGRFSSGAITPYDAWTFYQRINDRFSFDAIPVAVSDFANQIETPAESQLLELYSKYADTLPDPASPDPGFKEPRKVQIQYALANLDQFTNQIRPEVTEEEMKQHYEERKDLYLVTPKLTEDKQQTDKDAGTEAEGPAHVPDQKTDETPGEQETKPDQTAPDKAADQPKVDATNPKPNNPPPENPSESGETQQDSGAPVNDAANGTDPKGDSPFVPELDAQETGTKSGEADSSHPGSEEKQAKPPAESEPQPPADHEKANQPLDKGPGQAAPSDTPAKEPATGQPDAEASQAPAEPETEPEKKPILQYKPFEEVRDEIHKRLAREKAEKELLKRFAELGVVVRAFQAKLLDAKEEYEVQKEQNPKLVFKPPVPKQDFGKLAAQLELGFLQTDLLALDQVSKLEGFSDARQLDSEAFPGQGVAQTIARDDEYNPASYQNQLTDQFFLIWKSADQAERVLPFEQVKDQVVRAYKMIKARDLAHKQAEEYREGMKGMKGDVTKFLEQNPKLSHDTVPLTPLWTSIPWFSPNTTMYTRGYQPSAIPGMEYAGLELRDKIFEMSQGDIEVAFNQPKDTCYVIVLEKRERSTYTSFASWRPLGERQLLGIKFSQLRNNWTLALRQEMGLRLIDDKN